MRQKLYQAIEMAVAAGVPLVTLAATLIQIGWPPAMVNQAIDEWLVRNAQKNIKTDFKTWVKKYQRRAVPAVGIVVALGVGQAAFMLLRPVPLKIMADSALGTIKAPGPLAPYTHQPKLIAITSLMTITIFLLGAGFSWMSDFLLLRIGFWLNRSIKAESFRHILHLPLYHQQRLAKGDYVYRQNVVTNSLSELVLGSTASIISSIIMIIGVLLIMSHYSVRLTMIPIILMPLLYITMRIISPHMGKYSRRLNEINSKTASAINEAVDNAETVQAFTLEEKLLLRVNDLWNAGYQATKMNLLWSNALKYTNNFLVILANAIAMYFGGSAALKHQITFGELFIFMTYMGYLLGPVENLVRRTTNRYQMIADVTRVYEVLSDHEGIESLRQARQLPLALQGAIDFQNVSYSYNGQPVFKNLSLHVNTGEKVGIIGPSGGGKSTLLKLLPLFIEPEGGTILLDGMDIQSVSLQGLRQKVAWVSQSPQLFTGSIIENMYDGDIYRQVSVDEIKHALEVANVLEFTIKLPMGVNSPAGENGSSLSGGQRQRVAIARALIKNAPILCLDEPTAALDAKSENYIRDSLMQMIQNKTVMMVTHRKSLLSLMDTIYVLDNGTLTNVNELGGLDSYLKHLEGLAEEKVAKEIAEDKWYARPEAIERSTDISKAARPVARAIPARTQTADAADAAASEQIFTIDDDEDETAPVGSVTVALHDSVMVDNDEVTIKLH